jgi:putative membrane protein
LNNQKQIRTLNFGASILSVCVLLVVVLMRRIHLETSFDFGFLPPLYSSLNVFSAILLIIAYWHIKNKRIVQHQKIMTSAMLTSFIFLLCYVLYHITTPETMYCKEGVIRYVYFFLLISHVILAAISFPFVLFTFVRGYTRQDEAHKKMARWIFPIWLYVCITGPLCYLMLYPCYK